jgi:hypothetical protein
MLLFKNRQRRPVKGLGLSRIGLGCSVGLGPGKVRPSLTGFVDPEYSAELPTTSRSIDRCGLGKVTQAADVFGLRPARLGQEGVVDPVTRHKDADDLLRSLMALPKAPTTKSGRLQFPTRGDIDFHS